MRHGSLMFQRIRLHFGKTFIKFYDFLFNCFASLSTSRLTTEKKPFFVLTAVRVSFEINFCFSASKNPDKTTRTKNYAAKLRQKILQNMDSIIHSVFDAT